jgi:hypothetical protein
VAGLLGPGPVPRRRAPPDSELLGLGLRLTASLGTASAFRSSRFPRVMRQPASRCGVASLCTVDSDPGPRRRPGRARTASAFGSMPGPGRRDPGPYKKGVCIQVKKCNRYEEGRAVPLEIRVGMADSNVETVALSSCIEIEAVYKTKMLPSTLDLANEVVSKIGDMDSAILPQVGDADIVHACAGLGGCPFAQGATPQLSLAAFKAWLVASALAVPGVTGNNQLVGVHGSAWYNLNDDQANDIVYSRWQIFPWIINIRASPYNGGQLAQVYWFVGTRPSQATAFIARNVFG